jgi:hypothetical protein
MRKKNQIQLPLMINKIDHPHAEELQRISDILDKNPIINELVLCKTLHVTEELLIQVQKA